MVTRRTVWALALVVLALILPGCALLENMEDFQAGGGYGYHGNLGVKFKGDPPNQGPSSAGNRHFRVEADIPADGYLNIHMGRHAMKVTTAVQGGLAGDLQDVPPLPSLPPVPPSR